jgi:hypothetical protein
MIDVSAEPWPGTAAEVTPLALMRGRTIKAEEIWRGETAKRAVIHRLSTRAVRISRLDVVC